MNANSLLRQVRKVVRKLSSDFSDHGRKLSRLTSKKTASGEPVALVLVEGLKGYVECAFGGIDDLELAGLRDIVLGRLDELSTEIESRCIGDGLSARKDYIIRVSKSLRDLCNRTRAKGFGIDLCSKQWAELTAIAVILWGNKAPPL